MLPYLLLIFIFDIGIIESPALLFTIVVCMGGCITCLGCRAVGTTHFMNLKKIKLELLMRKSIEMVIEC